MHDIFEKTLDLVQRTYPTTIRSDTQHFGDGYSEKFVLSNREIEAYLGYHEIKREFHTAFWQAEDEYYFAQNIMDSLKMVINDLNWEGILFPATKAKYHSPRQLLAYGTKAEYIREMLKQLNVHYDVRCYRGQADFIHGFFKYEVDWDIESQSISIKNDEKDTQILKTLEDVESFVVNEKEMRSEIIKAEQTIIAYTQELDPTSYHPQTPSGSSYVYIFGVRLPFGLIKVGTMENPKFKLSFNDYEVTGLTLKELEIQAKDKIKAYINKNRLKAVTSSNYDMVERHLAFMFGHHISKAQFLKGLISDMSSDEIMGILRKALPEEVVIAENEKNETFLNYLKNNKHSYKLKSSFQIKNLVIFITASTYFVFQENED